MNVPPATIPFRERFPVTFGLSKLVGLVVLMVLLNVLFPLILMCAVACQVSVPNKHTWVDHLFFWVDGYFSDFWASGQSDASPLMTGCFCASVLMYAGWLIYYLTTGFTI